MIGAIVVLTQSSADTRGQTEEALKSQLRYGKVMRRQLSYGGDLVPGSGVAGIRR